MQGNASLQAGSLALQPGNAKSASPGFHSGQPAFATLKIAPPSPRSPGEAIYKVAKTLHLPFRKNRFRSRTKIWFINAPGLPPAFHSGRAVPRSSLHCRQAAIPPLFKPSSPPTPRLFGGLFKVKEFLIGGQNIARNLAHKPHQAPGKTLVRNAPAQAGCLSLRPGRHPAPDQGLHCSQPA
jgi:hypothetical protein